jgi:protein involved in polysaccharide export with SLBB domain
MSLGSPLRIGALSLLIGLSACAAGAGGPDLFTPRPQPSADFPNIGYATWSNAEPPYRLYPGDQLDIQVPAAPELNRIVTVEPDGRIRMPLIGPVMVADRSLVDAEGILGNAYSSQLLRPEVNIDVKAATALKVFVGGEVDKPGVYDMPGDINALQAVVMAGGFKTSAKRSEVVVIRRGPDGRAMLRTVNLISGITNAHTDLVPLRRFDVIYVPRTGISEVGLFVQQYFKDVTPVQLGFSYVAGSGATSGTIF